jgi:hypothetical protein
MFRTDTDPTTLEQQLRDSIYRTERMGFSATAAAMREVLAELLVSRERADEVA